MSIFKKRCQGCCRKHCVTDVSIYRLRLCIATQQTSRESVSVRNIRVRGVDVFLGRLKILEWRLSSSRRGDGRHRPKWTSVSPSPPHLPRQRRPAFTARCARPPPSPPQTHTEENPPMPNSFRSQHFESLLRTLCPEYSFVLRFVSRTHS